MYSVTPRILTAVCATLYRSYRTIRPDAEERAETSNLPGIIRRKGCLCLLTGFGERVSFQILSFLFDHKRALVDGKKRSCVIVSPRIALMVDQVRNLRKSGVQAVISYDSRESSVVGKKSLATESSFRSASRVSRSSGPYQKEGGP